MPIPWEKVILHGPQVLDAARGLYSKWQTRSKTEAIDPNADIHVQLQELASRLKVLEEGEETQSGIIEQLAEQGQAISTGVAELKKQITDIDAKSEGWNKLETLVGDQLKDYSAQLERLERVSDANSRKINLALYTAFAAFALASLALLLLLAR